LPISVNRRASQSIFNILATSPPAATSQNLIKAEERQGNQCPNPVIQSSSLLAEAYLSEKE